MPSGRSIPDLVPKHEQDYPHSSLLTLTDPITYYVNNAEGVGSDDNDGLTTENPFATIGKAMFMLPETVLSGVSINVANGTYPETVWFNKRCVRGNQQGYITLAGNSTWLNYSTATILSVEAEDRGHRVKFSRAITAAEQGLRGRFTDGNESGNTFWMTYVDPMDRTEVIISQDMGAVTSRAVTLETPGVLITGDGTNPPIIVDRNMDECYYNTNQSYNVYDVDIVQDRVGAFYTSFTVQRGTIYIEDSLFDGFWTATMENPSSVYMVECSQIGSRVMDMLTMAYVENNFYYCSFSASTGRCWNTIVRFTECTMGPGYMNCWDNTYFYPARCFLYNAYLKLSGSNNTLWWDTCVSSRNYTAQADSGNHNSLNFYGGIVGSVVKVFFGTHASLVFDSCELCPESPGSTQISLWEEMDSTHNTVKLYGVTYTNSPKILLGPVAGIIDLATLPPSVVADSAVFNCLNKMEV